MSDSNIFNNISSSTFELIPTLGFCDVHPTSSNNNTNAKLINFLNKLVINFHLLTIHLTLL